MSVKPSARKSSSATYCGAMQMPAIFASRTVVVSGGPSWAHEAAAPMRPATPADESVDRKRRRLCVDCIMGSLLLRCEPTLCATLRNSCNAELEFRYRACFHLFD